MTGPTGTSGAASDSGRKPGAQFRSGYVSITGRTNVGKSTLLNTVLGEKVSIVTSRPQTTRNRIIGIKTLDDAQIIFVDTPGLHRPRHGLGAHMVREARAAIKDVDVVLLMVEPHRPGEEDLAVLGPLREAGKPVFLLINKIDRVKKPQVLPVIEAYRGAYPFEEIIPVSALKGDGIDLLLERIIGRLGPGPKYYPDDLVTDSLERFMVQEIIREKVMTATSEEVPHSAAVEVTRWEEKGKNTVFIGADIYVEKKGQKGIIIGKHGSRLKEIGTSARKDIQDLLGGAKVFLELFVKVKQHWRTDLTVLRELGFK